MTRVGGPGGILKVRVEIDKLGDLKLKISDLFNGRTVMGKSSHIRIILYVNAYLLIPCAFDTNRNFIQCFS